MKEFQDKVAVITGAASGIGLALAKRCVAEGMKVVLADIRSVLSPRVYRQLLARWQAAGFHPRDVSQ